MKTNPKSALLCALLIGSAAVTSCKLDDYIVPPEEEYTRQFIKEFGLIDNNQDWNMATKQFVIVNPGNSDRIIVYADVDGVRYTFADYINVKGTTEVIFDLPRKIDTVIVSVNGMNKTVKVGDTVDFPSKISRVAHYGESSGMENLIKIEKTEQNEWMEIWGREGLIYQETLPEKTWNLHKVNDRFYCISTGEPFIIYPVYWETYRVHTLGIYWHEGGKMKTMDIYDNNPSNIADEVILQKDGAIWEDIKIKDYHTVPWIVESMGNDFDTNQLRKNADIYNKFLDAAQNHGAFYNARYLLDSSDEYKTAGGVTIEASFKIGHDGEWTSVKSPDANPAYQPTEIGKIRSKGVKVTIPEGLRFGFYSKVGDDYTFYSESKYNTDPLYEMVNGKKEKRAGEYARHMATFKGRKYGWRYIGVEDWSEDHGDSDMDLNDLIIRISEPGPMFIDKDEEEKAFYSWIIAAEDLGATDDFDFNDLVIRVTPGQTDANTGKKMLTLSPLAAGGTLPIYLCFDENGVSPKPIGGDSPDGREFHAWFGDRQTPTTSMINTGSGITLEGHDETITVSKDFTLGYYDKVNGYGNMGGFSILVKRDDKLYSSLEDAKYYVSAPGKGQAPQMICVPGGWAWPIERHDIRLGYKKFENWTINYEETEWWKEEYYIEHLYRVPNFTQGGDNTGEEPEQPTPINKVATIECIDKIFWNNYNVYKVTIPKDWFEVGSVLNFSGTEDVELCVNYEANNISDSDRIAHIRGMNGMAKYSVTNEALEKFNEIEDNYMFYTVDYANSLISVTVE